MRHLKRTVKLGRTSAHRDALLASLVCNLVAAKRICTTVPKAKAARSLAEKMVTLGKKGTLAARRLAVARLHRAEPVKILFEAIAPAFKDRAGGYTRIVRLGQRSGDGAEMALLEWVNYVPQPPKKKPSKEKGGKQQEAAAASKEARSPRKAEAKSVRK